MHAGVPLDRGLAQAGLRLFQPRGERGMLTGERVGIDGEIDCTHVAI